MKSNSIATIAVLALLAVFASNSILLYRMADRQQAPSSSARLDATPGEAVQATKLVTVDVDAVFEKCKERLVSQEAIDQKGAKYTEETQKLTQQAKDRASELESERLALKDIKDEAKKKEAEEALVGKVKELRAFEMAVAQKARSYQEEIARESSQASAEILQEIYKVIKRKAEAHGYKQVINSNAMDRNGVPVVLYNQDSIDLTSIIIEAINQGQ